MFVPVLIITQFVHLEQSKDLINKKSYAIFFVILYNIHLYLLV